MASSADRRAGDGTPAPRGECSDQRPSRKTRATPTPTSRGRRSSNALHRAATSRHRRAAVIHSYSSDVPEPRDASDGGEETTESATCSAVVGWRRRHDVTRWRLLVLLNAHRPEHVHQNKEFTNITSRTMSSGHLPASQ